MKRVCAVLLALVLACGCLAGCMPAKKGLESSSSSIASQEQANATPLSDSEIKELYANPDRFTGRTVNLAGKVFTEPEKGEKGIYFQIFSDAERSEGNIVVSYMDPDFELTDGDYVKLTGTVQGEYNGTNAFGGKVMAVQVLATELEKSSYIEVVAPAIKTWTSDDTTLTQHGYTVTLTKIEFADQETRLYLTVANNGKDKFNLYSFNTKVVQDGKQYEEQTNYDADYPEVQTDLLPGTSTEGVIAFPALEQKNMQVILEAYSDDYQEDFEPYTFDVSID